MQVYSVFIWVQHSLQSTQTIAYNNIIIYIYYNVAHCLLLYTMYIFTMQCLFQHDLFPISIITSGC